MLEVIGLSCLRNDTVLFSNLTFKLASSAALQICGANGTGKTTLLRTIAGIFPAAAGTVACSKAIIYLGHKNNLHPALTPLQNLRFLCAINAGTSHDIDQALNVVDLQTVQHVPCAELSAGQNQRVAIARLLLTTAKLWLLDEPFVNLDQAGKNLLLKLCAQHLANNGMLLIATHIDFNLTALAVTTLCLEHYA